MDGATWLRALLAILSCDVAKGIRKVVPRPEEPVLVAGAGAIGLLAVFVLRAYGVRVVDVNGLARDRRALSERLGAREAPWTPKRWEPTSTLPP